MTRTWLQILALCVVGATAALDGHHGTTINYDRAKQWTANVVVVEFRYINPHAQLFFDRRKDDGTVEHLSGELLPNPAQLLRNGWTRKRSVEALKPGTTVKVTALPAYAGGNVVLVQRIENAKGEELLGAAPAPGGPEPPAGARP